jgi:hypothetical protein
MGWDPRSGIRKKPIPDPGIKKAPDPGFGSATLVCPNALVIQYPWWSFRRSTSSREGTSSSIFFFVLGLFESV